MDEEEDQYVLNFDQVDFDNYQFSDQVEQLGQGVYESLVENNEDETETFTVCFPCFNVEKVDINTESEKRNEYMTFNVDESESEHKEFREWFENFDDWVIQNIIKNHPKWFSSLWKPGGKMYGKPKPPPEILASMFERPFDGTTFSLRVPMKKGVPQIECFDLAQTSIPIESIRNCGIVPLVEFKAIHIFSKKTKVDLVLRAICAQSTYQEMGIEYNICENEEAPINEDDIYATDEEVESENEEGEEEDGEEEDGEEEDGEEDGENGEEDGEEEKDGEKKVEGENVEEEEEKAQFENVEIDDLDLETM